MIIINHFYYLCPLWSWKRRFLESSEGSEGSEGSKGSEGKVDGPSGRGLCRRVASLRSRGDSGFAAEGCGLPLRAMLIKSALRDLLSVSYDMISILVISRCAAPPYPAAPDFLHGKACHTILRSLCSLTARLSPTHNILRVTAFLQNMFAGVTRVPLPPLCRGQNRFLRFPAET